MPAPTGWGIPSPGDRSARDTHTYAHLHASDIEEEEHQVHVPVPAAPDLGAVALVRLVGSVYQWVKTHLSGAISVDGDGVATLADHAHAGVAGDGGQIAATDLDAGEATDGQVLTADGVGGADWEAIPAPALDLDDLGDVNAPAPTDGQVLTWDDTADEWVADDPPTGIAGSEWSVLTDGSGSAILDDDNDWIMCERVRT